MMRRLIIGCGTLGAILVAFGLYRSRNVLPEKPLPALPEVTVATATAPVAQQTIPGLKNLWVAPGKEANFEFFDQKGQTAVPHQDSGVEGPEGERADALEAGALEVPAERADPADHGGQWRHHGGTGG